MNPFTHPNRVPGALVLLAFALAAAPATAQLEWRVSVKIFLDQNDRRPIDDLTFQGCCALNEDAEIIDEFEGIGDRIEGLRDRGYRLRVVEIVPLSHADLPVHPPGWTACVGGRNTRHGCLWYGDCPGGACVMTELAACVGGPNNRDPCNGDEDCPEGRCFWPQTWFDAASNGETNQAIRESAWADYALGPNRFALRPDAINVYVLGTPGGGICNCQYASGPSSEAIIIVGQSHHETVPVHEVGHWLGLCHTHGCGNPPDDFTGNDETEIGIDDTLPDNPCWDDQRVIALMNFGACTTGASCAIKQRADCARENGTLATGQACNAAGSLGACFVCDGDDSECVNRTKENCSDAGGRFFGAGSTCRFYFDELDAHQREQVDDVFHNLMSYHWESTEHDRLTPDQLDRMTDVANGVQVEVTSGCTRFVDADATESDLIGISACDLSGVCVGGPRAGQECVSERAPFSDCPLGICNRNLDGGSRFPYPTLEEAADIAAPGDIVLLRGGSYDERLVIDAPVTLRASRGNALIGDRE